MSNNISKNWTYESGYLGQKDSKKVKIAIDIMPLAYKYLYVGDMGSPQGPLRCNDVITSHIYHLILYLLKLKKLNIDPYVCTDYHCSETNNLKAEVIQKRSETRSKIVESFKQKLENNTMSVNDWYRYNTARFYLNQTDILFLTRILKGLGLKNISVRGVEAESLCAYLKKQKFVDECYSTDRDITLYGVDALIELNPLSGHYLKYENDKNMGALGLPDRDSFLDCAIAAGTDYSTVPHRGAKTAVKSYLKDKSKFLDLLQTHVGKEKVEEIKNLFNNNYKESVRTQIAADIKELDESTLPDPEYMRNLLEEIEFSPNTINQIITKLVQFENE